MTQREEIKEALREVMQEELKQFYMEISGSSWVCCDENGDVYFNHKGSGASSLTVGLRLLGIQT